MGHGFLIWSWVLFGVTSGENQLDGFFITNFGMYCFQEPITVHVAKNRFRRWFSAVDQLHLLPFLRVYSKLFQTIFFAYTCFVSFPASFPLGTFYCASCVFLRRHKNNNKNKRRFTCFGIVLLFLLCLHSYLKLRRPVIIQSDLKNTVSDRMTKKWSDVKDYSHLNVFFHLLFARISVLRCLLLRYIHLFPFPHCTQTCRLPKGSQFASPEYYSSQCQQYIYVVSTTVNTIFTQSREVCGVLLFPFSHIVQFFRFAEMRSDWCETTASGHTD